MQQRQKEEVSGRPGAPDRFNHGPRTDRVRGPRSTPCTGGRTVDRSFRTLSQCAPDPRLVGPGREWGVRSVPRLPTELPLYFILFTHFYLFRAQTVVPRSLHGGISVKGPILGNDTTCEDPSSPRTTPQSPLPPQRVVGDFWREDSKFPLEQEPPCRLPPTGRGNI